MRKQHGFTLIELLIVLAILGILIGIVAMSVGDLTETAEERGRTSEFQIVQTAYDTYMTQDVLVSDAPLCTGTLQIIDLDNADCLFCKYLRRGTKYPYRWDATNVYTN